jgi:hypothetical protein
MTTRSYSVETPKIEACLLFSAVRRFWLFCQYSVFIRSRILQTIAFDHASGFMVVVDLLVRVCWNGRFVLDQSAMINFLGNQQHT